MINPTNPPTDQQIHQFQTHHQPIPTHRSKPSLPIHDERWERDRVKLRRSTTNNPLQPQPTLATTQPWPKHRTQPRPTTRSQPKKKNHNRHSDRHQKPQPPLTHAVTHPQKKKKSNHRTVESQPTRKMSHCDVWCWCWEENGVWVWREERADGETEKEKREENWNNEIEEREKRTVALL